MCENQSVKGVREEDRQRGSVASSGRVLRFANYAHHATQLARSTWAPVNGIRETSGEEHPRVRNTSPSRETLATAGTGESTSVLSVRGRLWSCG